jgi:PAS domain S-box-containing protein
VGSPAGAEAAWLPGAAVELFEQIQESVAVYDRDARLLYLNPATERLFGRPRAELLGQVLWDLFPEAVGNPFHQAFTRALASGEAQRFEHAYEPWGRVFNNRIYPWGPGVCVISGDVTADKQAAVQVERARREAESAADRTRRLQRLTETLLGARTQTEVASAIVHAGGRALDAGAGYAWLLTGDGQSLHMVASDGLAGPRVDAYRDVPLDASLPVCEVVRTGELRLVASQQEMDARYPESNRGGPSPFRAWAVFPLRAGGRCVGGVSLSFPTERTFGADDRALLEAMSSQASLALERCRLFEGEREARADAEVAAEKVRQALEVARRAMDRLRVLARVSRAINEERLDVPSVCRAVARHVAEELGDACGVNLVADSADRVDMVASHDVDEVALAALQELQQTQPVRLEDSLNGRVIRTGQSLFIPVVDQPRLLASAMPEFRQYLEGHPVHSLLVVPIRHAGKVLGTLALVRRDPARPYEEADVALVEDLAARTALAITRARERQELEEARRKAQEANRAKDEFLAMLGHELRNPLAPMQTALELMQMRAPAAATNERVVIERQMKHMVRLVDDLLDVSRITGGKVILRKAVVELQQVVGKAIEVASPLLEQRAQTLVTDLPAGLPVLADDERLAQVVSNLLTNAAKYTEPGGRIEVQARREAGQVRLSVKDNGMGIDPDLLPSIFQLFVQGRQAMDRSAGGLGLGLTIVRTLVEMHGGQVSAHSDGPGRGSEFVVRLPLVAGSEVQVSPAALESHGPPAVPAEQTRVLVVDDNQDAAETLAEALTESGFRTCVAYDALQALQLALEFHPEVALLDIGLPVMDGYELARRMKEDARLAPTRLVALTGYGQSADRERALAGGFDEHLVKPVELSTVENLVRELSRG